MFETTIAGSLPKPVWLAEPERLWPAWKLSGAALEAGKLDATVLAVKLQEDAGIDIVSDGEQARIHFVHGFLANLDGIDFDRKTVIGIRNNRYKAEAPTVVGPIRRKGPVHAAEAAAARAHTRRKLKFTLPGPMTIADTIADEHYRDRAALAHAFAEALNEEARELEALGVDVVQFDEPAFNVYLSEVAEWGIGALERAAQRSDVQNGGPHLLRLWHQGQHRLEGDAWRAMAALRRDFSGHRAQFDRSGLARMSQFACAHRGARAAEGKGRAGRRDRCRVQRRREPGGGRGPSARRWPMFRPSVSFRAPIAEWPRCRRKSPTPSSRRWRPGLS